MPGTCGVVRRWGCRSLLRSVGIRRAQDLFLERAKREIFCCRNNAGLDLREAGSGLALLVVKEQWGSGCRGGLRPLQLLRGVSNSALPLGNVQSVSGRPQQRSKDLCLLPKAQPVLSSQVTSVQVKIHSLGDFLASAPCVRFLPSISPDTLSPFLS